MPLRRAGSEGRASTKFQISDFKFPIAAMWSAEQTPTLTIEQLAQLNGKTVRATKEQMEDYWRIKNGKAELIEKRAAAIRHKRGPQRVNEALGDARPTISMSKLRWLQLHRASMIEKGDRGGSLLGENSDFTEWMLKRPDLEHLRVTLAKTTNKIGWTPPLANVRLANAADWGRKERAGQTIIDPTTGGYTR